MNAERDVHRLLHRQLRRLGISELEVPPSHYEPGATSEREPTTGARAGGKGRTEEREAVEL